MARMMLRRTADGCIHRLRAGESLQRVPAAIHRELLRIGGETDRENFLDIVLHGGMGLKLRQKLHAFDEAHHVALVRAHVEVDVGRRAGVRTP